MTVKQVWLQIQDVLSGDQTADRVVPPSGYTSGLTSFSAGVMAFLAVFAMALSLATGKLAERWSTELSKTSTIRVSAPEGQMEAQVAAVLEVLKVTPGVTSSRVLPVEEQRLLLEPWMGPDLPLDSLPIPQLIELIEEGDGPDADGLRQRLAGEAPGAILDDHTRWRKPLANAAYRLRSLAILCIILIGVATAAIVTLAAQAALSANGQVIGVLRLIGSQDSYIVKAFVRRFTIRAFLGAAIGTLFAMVCILFLPSAAEEGAFLTGLGFRGLSWFIPLVVPPIMGIVAFFATRAAAIRTLSGMA